MNQIEQKYDQGRIFKRINKTLDTLKIILPKYYDEVEQQILIDDAMKEIEPLISELPYIGEKENIFLGDFFDSLLFLALYKALNEKKSAARHVGKLMYEMREYQSSKSSKFSRFILSHVLFTSFIRC